MIFVSIWKNIRMTKDLRRKMKYLAREMKRIKDCSYIDYIVESINKKATGGSKRKLNKSIKKLKTRLIGRFRDNEMPYLIGCLKDCDYEVE